MMSKPKRVALITGGSRGLGLGIAEQLAADGFALAIHGRRRAAEVLAVVEHLQTLRPLPDQKRLSGQGTGQGTEVIYCQADVADATDRQRLVDQVRESFGQLDVLVNKTDVASHRSADLLDATPESVEQLIGNQLKGPYFLTQLVARWMVEQRQADEAFSGVIINVASATAELLSIDHGDYGIGKAGMAMATKLWATRLAEFGIQVYEVRPGIFRTEMTEKDKKKVNQLLAEGLVLEPRWGDPAELGRAIKLLVSGEFSYATGNVLNLDGGLTLPRL